MFDKEKLRALIGADAHPAVSVFLPTHVAGREIRQDPIRLRRLLDQAAARLGDHGLRRPEIDAILAPAYRLVGDEVFWREQDRGLAVFAAPGVFEVMKLPAEMPEEVTVGKRFHVKHLLPLLADDGVFHIVALSARQTRLFEADRFGITEKTGLGFPAGVGAIAAATDYDPEINAIPGVHAHSFGDDPEAVRRAELLDYLHRVTARIEEHLSGRRDPVIVAAQPEIRGHFFAMAKRLALVETPIDVNPETLSRDELHRRGFELARPLLGSARAAALAQLNSLVGSGDGKATLKPEEIVKAARWGRVDTLFIAPDGHLWGRFDEAADRVEAHGSPGADDEDLADYAAAQTLLQGGRVELLPRDALPRNGIMAAILRY